MVVFLRTAVSLMLLGAAGCGALPRPPTGPVPPGAAGEEVPYPPPPARVETVPPRHADGEVWIDGQWDWEGEAWRWLSGAWVSPPPNAYFTPWTTTLESNGRFLFVRATWRRRDGRPLGPGLGFGAKGCSSAPSPAPRCGTNGDL
jgi:hypothetical protein